MTKPASDKQMSFIQKLMSERVTDEHIESAVASWGGGRPDVHRASMIIDYLLNCDKKPNAKPSASVDTSVPAGRYAVDYSTDMAPDVVEHGTVFVKIDRPTEGRWAGYVFVTQLSGENHRPIRARGAKAGVFRAIERAGAEAAMKRYGRELGVCGNCGKRLTDDASRAMGIGPDCFEKLFGRRRTADERKAAIAADQGQLDLEQQAADAEARMHALEAEGDSVGTRTDEAGKLVAQHLMQLQEDDGERFTRFARWAARIGDAIAEGAELWKIEDGIADVDDDDVFTDEDKAVLLEYARALEAREQLKLKGEFGF